VCGLDPYCCEFEWDNICVAEASALCGLTPPVNDECAGSIALTNQPVAFSTIGATTNGPQHPGCLPDGIGADVWFTYNATFSGTATIRTCGNFLMSIVVYDNCSCPLLGAPLACSGWSLGTCGSEPNSFHASFGVFNGQCVKIRIGGMIAGEDLYYAGDGEITITKDFCVGDTDDDNDVDIDDLLAIINQWGFVAAPGTLQGDVATPGGDGVINIDDLLVIINGWGDCPSQCPVGFVCGGPDNPPCREGSGSECVCFTSFNGNRVCAQHGFCEGFECVNGSCPPGYVCVVDTCCGVPVCLPTCGQNLPPTAMAPGTRTSAGVVGADGQLPHKDGSNAGK
jgi:hypothetical protein